jgi:hypothetical protein
MEAMNKQMQDQRAAMEAQSKTALPNTSTVAPAQVPAATAATVAPVQAPATTTTPAPAAAPATQTPATTN